MAVENLIESIDHQIVQIRTKNLDISFNELHDMYLNGELVISPDYQRLFRWNEERQSRFIESLLLEMPVPPIFVVEIQDGIYELIDGLQRISSYLHFRGTAIGDSNDGPLILKGSDIIPDLNGAAFDQLPKALQIKLKRTFIRMEVIRKESERSLKYHMFKRLNSGGELLSDQENRNCTIRLLGSSALNFIEQCSQNGNFKHVIEKIGTEQMKRKYDQELVLRFFALKNNIQEYRYPFSEFLTRYLEKMANPTTDFNYKQEQYVFDKTFDFIDHYLGKDIFSSKTKNDFSEYCFDGIAIAIANLLSKGVLLSDRKNVIEKISEIKYSEQLQAYTNKSPNSVIKRIELFEAEVRKIIDGR